LTQLKVFILKKCVNKIKVSEVLSGEQINEGGRVFRHGICDKICQWSIQNLEINLGWHSIEFFFLHVTRVQMKKQRK